MKKTLVVAVLCAALLCGGCGQSAQMTEEIGQLNTKIAEKDAELASQKTQLSESEKKLAELQKQVDELNQKLESAKPWFELEEKERQEQAEQLEAEKAAAEEKARLEKEAEEKVGYNTGITYNQLARTPDEYKGKKVKFYGRVAQVMEGEEIHLRIAVSGNYNNVIYSYSKIVYV